MEEDIQNYPPTVMFRGTPCRTKENKNIPRPAWLGVGLKIVKAHLNSN